MADKDTICFPGAGCKRSAKQGVEGQRGGGGRPCHHPPCYRRPHLYWVQKNVLLCHKTYHYLLIFHRYIFLVLFRCYRKLWSAKAFTSAACQTDKELALNGGHFLCKTVNKIDQPGSATLDKTISNHTPRDAVQEQLFPKTPSDVQNESITETDLQSQPQKLSLPKSPIPKESAVNNENKQVSELVPSKELDEDFKEFNLLNGNSEKRQNMSMVSKKSANFDKSYSEDDTVLLKLKNEDEVDCCNKYSYN